MPVQNRTITLYRVELLLCRAALMEYAEAYRLDYNAILQDDPKADVSGHPFERAQRLLAKEFRRDQF